MKKLFFLIWTGPSLLVLNLLYRALYASFDLTIDSLLYVLCGTVLLKTTYSKASKWLIFALGLYCAYLLKGDAFFIASLALSLALTHFSLIGFKEAFLAQKMDSNKAQVFEKLLQESLKKQGELKDQLEALYSDPIDSIKDIEHVELNAYFEQIQDEIAFENYLEQLEKEVQKKEQKRPLRRLQKIVMKQTTFFDES